MTLICYNELKKRKDFIFEFSSKLVEFSGKPEFDNALYFWLTQNSVAIQSELGPYGIIAYKPPAADYMYPNYQIIVNLLPELRRAKTGTYLFQDYETQREQASMCLDVLIRYSGVLEQWLKETRNDFHNPLVWLRQGFQTILLIPAYILYWFGILGTSTLRKLIGNSIIKGISVIVTLVGILSGLVTIAVGWDQSVNIVMILWKNLTGH